MSATTERWVELHQDPKHQLRYPSEHVVRFVAPLKRGSVVDIGCGAGRHTRLLWELGFMVTACDISIGASGLPVVVDRADMTDLPYADDVFEVGLAFGVFYYGSRDQHLKAASELHRVLKPGGRALVVTRTIRDSRSGGNRECVVSGGDEDGMRMNFLTGTDIPEVYGVFGGVEVELAETTRFGRRWLDSDWIIRLTK